MTPYLIDFPRDDIEEVVSRHFAEWGQIERTRVLTGRGVAFITYSHEANAQFGKSFVNKSAETHTDDTQALAAMSNQALDHEVSLIVTPAR